MKILDELKREQAQRRGSAVREDESPAQDAPASEAVQRAMELLYAGLAHFAEELNGLTTHIRVSYDVEFMGTLKDLRQRKYSVASEDPKRPSFTFSFKCVGEHGLYRVLERVDERQQVQAALSDLGLVFKTDDMATWRYAISISPSVDVRLRFVPTRDGAAIRMEAQNLNRLGVELFSLAPERVSDELLNELGKLIVRRENRFAEMSGNSVSDEIRQKLRAKVESRQRYREKIAEDVKKDMGANQGGLKGRLRGGDAGSTAARPASQRPPIDVGGDASEGWVDWDGAGAGAPVERQPAPAKPAKRSAPAVPPAPPIDEELVPEAPRYAWMITEDVLTEDTAGNVAKRGPAGSQKAFPTRAILNDGEPFRLKTRQGEVRYVGAIVGDYQGVEPLVEYGLNHGCDLIEYHRGGEWVRVRPKD